MSNKNKENIYNTPPGKSCKSGIVGEEEYADDSVVNKADSSTFKGFDSAETSLYHRVLLLEKKLDKWISESRGLKGEDYDNEHQKELKERVQRLEENEEKLIRENEKLREEVAQYKRMMRESLGKVEKETDDIKELVSNEEQRVQEVVRKEVNAWKVQNEVEKISFKKVIENQMEQKREDVAKEVIGVLKQKEVLVREIAEKKKSVIIFGLEEKKITYKPKRVKEELKSVRDLLKTLNDEDRNKLEDEVEEIHRMGQYKEGTTRPVKVLLRSQNVTEEILYRTSKLREMEGCENIYIRRNRNEEERRRHNELVSEAKEKNNDRSKEEEKIFFWKVVGNRVRKWFIREREEESKNRTRL